MTIVVAIVPVLNPDPTFAGRLERIRSQVDHVIVVDDGSQPPVTGFDDPDVQVLRQENSGIAAAINSGIRFTRQMWPGVGFYLTVDQDSLLAPDYVAKALETYSAAVADGVQVGGVCAEKFNDWSVTALSTEKGYRSALQVAQSGLLMPAGTLTDFGLFDEKLFIDCVDTEYVLRLFQKGSLVLLAEGCDMTHEVGATYPLTLFGRQVRWRGRSRTFSYHSAVRRYYITRNRTYVYRKNFGVSPRWLLRDSLLETRTTLLSVAFGPDKGLQIRAVVFGAVDGVRGSLGKISEPRLRSFTRAR